MKEEEGKKKKGGRKRNQSKQAPSGAFGQTHLNHGVPDDPADVQSPFGHVRVVLVQVGGESQEMGLEVL